MAREPEATTLKAVGGMPIEVRGHWADASQLDPIYADQLHLVRLENQFFLVFGQTRLPVVEGRSSTVDAEIKPMARFVVSKEALGRMINLLNQNVVSE